MAVLPVVHYGATILRDRTKSVDDISALPSLVENMFDTMYEEEGIGLSANQVDFDANICVVDITHTEESDMPHVFVNGEITERWGETVMEEGCLSIPGIRLDVPRAERIRFRYEDLEGREHEEEFQGLLARVIQHEMDHLNGRLIIDRVSPVIRRQIGKQLKDIASGHTEDRSRQKTV